MIEICFIGDETIASWLDRHEESLRSSGFRGSYLPAIDASTDSEPPDLWVVDADGASPAAFEKSLAQLSRNEPSDQSPVLVTGKSISLNNARMAIQFGAQRFLPKPLTSSALATTCKNLGIGEPPATKIVLLLDYRQEINERIREYLAGHSLEIIQATTVRKGLDTLRGQQPDIVVAGKLKGLEDPGELPQLLSFIPESSALPILRVREAASNTECHELAETIIEVAGKAVRQKTTGSKIYDALYEREQERFALNQHAILSKTDSYGRITEVNRRFCEISQYSEEELLGQNHRILKSGHHSPEFYRNIWKTISAGTVWQGDICNRAKDGTLYWVSSTIVPFLDGRKRPYQYIAIRKDISHVKETERQIALQGKLSQLISEASAHVLSGHWSRAPYSLQEALQGVADFLCIHEVRISLNTSNPVLAQWKQAGVTPDRAPLLVIGESETSDPQSQSDSRTIGINLTAGNTDLGYLELFPGDEDKLQLLLEHNLIDMLGNLVSQALMRWMSEFNQERDRERLRRAQSFAEIGTWEWNLETDDLFWTDIIPVLFGYPEGDLETSFGNFITAVHPEDRNKVQSAIQDSIENDQPYEIEHRVVWPDGTIRWLQEKGAVNRNTDGKPTQMLGVVRDITRSHEAEEQLARQARLLNMLHDSLTAFILDGKFRATLDAMLDSLLELTDSEFGFLAEVLDDDRDTPYLRIQSITNMAWDPTSEEMFSRVGTDQFEFRDLSNMLGVSIHQENVVSVDESESPGLFKRLPKGHPSIHTFLSVPIFVGPDLVGVFALANRNGGYDQNLIRFLRPFSATYGVIINSQRMIDMEEVNRKSLVRAKLRADQANRAKSEFLSSMSHELRTPLNAIVGFSQLLESDSELDADQKDSVEEILSASRHLLTLINEVLDLARIESGKLELSLETVPVRTIVDDTLTLVRLAAEKQGLDIKTRTTGYLQVTADWTRLKQALLNIISNAIKYNRAGGSVLIDADLHDVAWVDIRVTDTGPGIPETRLSELFQPFNRLGAELGHIEGTGIGLSLTQRLVELMGGSVGVESEVGKGSTFWIRMPAVGQETPTSAQPLQASQSDRSLSKQRSDKPSKKILYIEDNPANLKLVERIVQRQSRMTLVSAITAADGLNLARSSTPDLILLDINLPDLDGYSVLRNLKAMENLDATPIIALTASAMHSEIRRGKNAGFDDYLTKPINIEELVNILQKNLG